MDASRASLAEARRNTANLTERVQSLQSELTESELRREEVESELKSAQEVRDKQIPRDTRPPAGLPI